MSHPRSASPTPSPRLATPSVALLDVDGTLLDSNDAHARAWADAFAVLGYPAGFSQVRPLIGMGGDKVLMALVGVDIEGPEGRRLVEHRTRIFTERYLPTLRPFPGVRDLLERMRADGLTLVVASSASGHELGGLLRAAGIQDLLDEATSSSDAEESKPDPDIIIAALKRARCEPGDALMLGDTPYDVEAARRAGVDVVAVRSGGWDGERLAGAIAVYDDAADLLARWDDSPFAGR